MTQGEKDDVATASEDGNKLKRKDFPPSTSDDTPLRLPKRLKEQFEERKQVEELEKQVCINEVEFDESKGSEIKKTWHVKKVRNLLLEILQVKPGADIQQHHKLILDDIVKRREEIESLAIFLAEQMVIKCQVHSEEYISDILAHNRELAPENDELQAKIMFNEEILQSIPEDSTPSVYKQKLDEWEKFTLPKIVSIQRELNLIEVKEPQKEDSDVEKLSLLNEYEEITHNDDFAFHLDDMHQPLKLEYPEEERLERLDSLEENQIEEVEKIGKYSKNKQLEGVCVYYNNEENLHIFSTDEISGNYDGGIPDETVYFKYLFDEMLPDETNAEYTDSPFLEMKYSLEKQYHNPFLYILETTMKMYYSEPEEHQNFKVSFLRLSTSLLILDCINTELIYLKNRVTREGFYIMARAIVRGVLDSFIDNRNPRLSCFMMDPDIYEYQVVTSQENNIIKEIKEELDYLLDDKEFDNDDSSITSGEDTDSADIGLELIITMPRGDIGDMDSNDSISSGGSDNSEFRVIDLPEIPYQVSSGEENPTVTEQQEEIEDEISECSTDTDSEIEIENDIIVGHPIWDRFGIAQEDVIEHNFLKHTLPDPVENSLKSSYDFLMSERIEEDHTGEQAFIQEPIEDQTRVTYYYNNAGKILMEQEGRELTISSLDHKLEASIDTEYQRPLSASIICDITRLMRRGMTISADTSAYFETFNSLKDYIQKVIEWLAQTKSGEIVTDKDVLDGIKNVHNTTHYTTIKHSFDYSDEYELYEPEVLSSKSMPPPQNISDVVYDTSLYSPFDPKKSIEAIETDERFEANDPLINNNNMAHHVCYFLGDLSQVEGSAIFNDTFIEFSDGTRLGIYSPIIKSRCPELYKFFETEEQRKSGLKITQFYESDIDFETVYEFIEYVYRGEAFYDDKYGILDLVKKYPILVMDYSYNPFQENRAELLLDNNDRFNACYTLHTLWKDEESKDFKLIIKNDNQEIEISVHKYILAARCEGFRKMMMENGSLDRWDVSDEVEDELVLNRFVYYLYHNFLILPEPEPIEDEESEDEESEDEKSRPSEVSSEQDKDISNETVEEEEEDVEMEESDDTEHVELSLLHHIELFKLSHKYKERDLLALVTRTICQQVDSTNVSDFLTLSIDFESFDLFRACEFVILSRDQDFIETVTELENEREYFCTLRGPITTGNVIEKLSYVMKVLNADSTDLEFNFIYSLNSFHKRKLIWYIIRNYITLDEMTLEALNFIPMDEKTTCAQVVKHLADKFHDPLNPLFIPNSHFTQ